jgi:hypothetical protein
MLRRMAVMIRLGVISGTECKGGLCVSCMNRDTYEYKEVGESVIRPLASLA